MNLLPAVRGFLETHGEHGVRFGDSDDVALPYGSEEWFDWLMEAGFVLQELPRYYAERLGFRTWEQVTAHVQSSKWPPSWWADEDQRRTGSGSYWILSRSHSGGSRIDGATGAERGRDDESDQLIEGEYVHAGGPEGSQGEVRVDIDGEPGHSRPPLLTTLPTLRLV